MPCNSDYMEANQNEKNLSVIYGLLDELETGKLPYNFGDGYDKRVYNKHLSKEHLDEKTEELCSKLQNSDVLKFSLEMQMWWRDHQKADKDRLKNVSPTDANNVLAEVFSHDEFLLRLSNLGLLIKVESYNDRDFRFHLELNGLNICSKKYPIFGYYCGGNYNSCSRSNQNDFTQKNIDNAVKESICILSTEISDVRKVPNYFSCKDYLNKHFGKTKAEKSAIDRVFKLIKDNYNDIIRSVSVS